jgi:hypothetical protein
MNSNGTATALEGTDGAMQVQEEALLEASLAIGGLQHTESASKTASKAMQCYACRQNTQERCSYCLLPVCEAHGGQVQLWFTSRYVMVCTPCQARLREIAKEEESL